MEMTTTEYRLRLTKWETLAARFGQISFCFLCAYLFDCAWSGAGRWLMVGPVSIRMALLGLALLFSVPDLLLHLKKIFKNLYILLLLAFLVVLIVSAVRGVRNHTNMAILKSDLKGFSYYVMIPTLLVTVNSRQRLKTVMKAIVGGSMLQALMITAIFTNYAVLQSRIPINLQKLQDLRIFAFNPMGGTLIRVFAFSVLYLIAGCVCAFFLFLRSGKMRWGYPAVTGLLLFALLVTFSRGVYLGLAVAFIVVLFATPGLLPRYRDVLKFLLVAVVVFSLILIPISIKGDMNYLSYAVEKTLLSLPTNTAPSEESPAPSEESPAPSEESPAPSEESPAPSEEEPVPSEVKESFELTLQADQLRAVTLAELHEKISAAPLFGQGLGAAVECRGDGMTEYFYLDLIHKTGFVGLGIYLAPLLFLLADAIKRKRKREAYELGERKTAFLCCLLSFMVVSYFNPFMNAALGVTMFSLTMAADSIPEISETACQRSPI